MKRWDKNSMLNLAKTLFAKVQRQKKHAHPNHDIHFMTREVDDWLPIGIDALLQGTYDPRCLKRYYFTDEVIDHVHFTDRIFQHVLLKQLKPTFTYVMNPHCYHLHGPTGVQYATAHIKQALDTGQFQYFIRADIKSFYKSILHYKLVEDIKKYYGDPKVVQMLENIIKNPIETPNGYQNPSYGVTLRGPLSQFFSGIYLKPLDDAFSNSDVVYARFQDDVVILCKTKRQFSRCKRRLMRVLQERKLSLSRKKSRFGKIETGFHFLGIHYTPTQIACNTQEPANDDVIMDGQFDLQMTWGGVTQPLHHHR